MHDGFSVRLYVQQIMPKRIGFSKDISREREREKREIEIVKSCNKKERKEIKTGRKELDKLKRI